MKKVKLIFVVMTFVVASVLLSTNTEEKLEWIAPSIHPILKAAIKGNDLNAGSYCAMSGSKIKTISPGVYVEEEAVTVRTITSVETDIAGFLGLTEKGPVEPQLVTSYQEYENIYGTNTASFLSHAVAGFFKNGGRKLYIARVTPKQTKISGTRLKGLLNIKTQSPTPQLSDYLGNKDTDIGPVSGLYALGIIDEISILYSPDAQRIAGLNQAMIEQCQTLRDRFVIMESSLGEMQPEPLTHYDSTFAAYYYPWVQIADPATGQNKLVPPGGFIAGLYAGNDLVRGVHKAPANVAIIGINGLERTLSESERYDMNSNKVNPIIPMQGRGILAYGARTLSEDLEYNYINLRRYSNYLKESVTESLCWASMESWNTALQNRIKTSVEDFLHLEWQKGALMGNTPRNAYYVTVEKTTVLRGDAYQPVIYIEIGAALTRPAEFYIIKVGIDIN